MRKSAWEGEIGERETGFAMGRLLQECTKYDSPGKENGKRHAAFLAGAEKAFDMI